MSLKRLSPLSVVALCWLAGLLVGRVVPLFWPFLIGFGLSLLLAFHRSRRSLWLFVACAMLAALRLNLPLPSNHLARLLADRPEIDARVTGRIVSGADSVNHGYRYRLRVHSVNCTPLRGTILLYTADGQLRPGDEVSCRAELQRLPEAANPNQPAWDEFYLGRGFSGLGFVRGFVQTTDHHLMPWTSTVTGVRAFLSGRMDLLGARSGFGRTLLLGMSEPWNRRSEYLADSGLTHLIAVSGLHIAILAGILSTLLSWFIRRKNVVGLLTILVITLYGAVCEWVPSATRAVLMISLFLFSRILQRRVSMNHLLAVSLLVITTVHPLQLFQPGFQLSFLGVFALVNLVPVTPGIHLDSEWLAARPRWRRRLNNFALALISSAILGIVLAPITLLHFHRVTLNAVVGNLIGIPLFGAILPLTLLIALLPEWHWLLSTFVAAFDLLAGLFDRWVAWTAGLPFGVDFIPFTTFQFWVCVVALSLFVLAIRQNSLRLAIPGLAALCLLWIPQYTRPKDMKLTFFDVGMGDAALIETPTARIMIDTGTAAAFHSRVLPYLQARGIRYLDALVLSHAHDDHAGGIPELSRECPIRLVIADSHTLQGIRTLFSTDTVIDSIGLDYAWGELRLSCHSPATTGGDLNEASLTALVVYRDFSALFSGDLSGTGEKDFLDNLPTTPIDVLKVAHHGSRNATSFEFLDAIRPQVAVISVAEHNAFGFPDRETLWRLTPLGDGVFSTGREGAVTISSDGYVYRVTGYRSHRAFLGDAREER